ncbi:virulence factor family protein [Aggregicoccus sp. 17bor-14]|uniref:AcvB/VirJ family lysyl-phosphatidylglycerol hydrolase n=1 Tax=Myxococcaceae TaxID=31 RepID=UPI00129C8EF2|nr:MULTISPECIES: AcvB/VirJ family lysyl-phosphatidylglycerol hydrolase [Myxococcaceae]MBF5045976.1 virulence factor family protein [Simulacricoccus sp. 17bor-14]MRI91708.1 virulence factor family protein [Aggregicoccus sp. 17bor-14]
MKRALLTATLLLALPALAGPAPKPLPPSFKAGRLGRVQVYRPEGAPTSAAVLLVDHAGDKGGEGAALGEALARGGTLVLEADARAYVASVKKDGHCVYPAGDVEVLAQAAQKQLELPEYLHPVVVGMGQEGAGLAYASLAQAPPGAFRGALSVGFLPRLALARGLCVGSGLVRERTADGTHELLRPAHRLPAPWRVLPRAAPDAPLEDFVSAVPGARLLAPVSGPLPEAASAALAALLHDTEAAAAAPPPVVTPPAPGAPAQAGAPLAPVDGLPLVLAPAAHPTGDALVLLVSGDGGWAGIDRELAQAFNAQGFNVLGWDSLRYFWRKRSPEEAADAMGRALAHYAQAWGAKRLVLVGYSRGADVLPGITARLPPAMRARVALLALLGPGQEAEYEVHVMDLLGASGRDVHPILPELARLPATTPVLCVYGDEEKADSLCPLLQGRAGASVTELPGGHHFEGDYATVARHVLGAARGGVHDL